MFDITIIQEIEGEPRMRDLDIAEALGFQQRASIRKLIYRNLLELSEFGIISTVETISGCVGRPGEEYWLNEQQAYYICTQSKAKAAFEVTKRMIEVFTAYRHGEVPPLQAPDSRSTVDDLLARPDYKARFALINAAHRIHGRKAAQEMWRLAGFPEVAWVEAQAVPEVNDDITLFLQENCIYSLDAGFTRTATLLSAYQGWCRATSRLPLPEFTFSKRLAALAGKYTDPQTGHGFLKHKASVSGYMGIGITVAREA